MSGESPDVGSDQIQEPITQAQYYERHADALQQEHTQAFLEYRQAAQAGARNLDAAQAKLDDVERRMRLKADEARRDLGDPDLS